MSNINPMMIDRLTNLIGGRALMTLPDHIKKGWLSDNFGDVCVKPEGEKFVASVPDVFFTVKAQNSLRNIFGKMVGKTLLAVRPAEAFGATPEESRINLSDRISVGFSFNCVRKFCPKEGQNKDDLIPGRTFQIIRRNHRLHDHASLELFDFQPMCLDVDLEVYTLDFDDFHSHLRPL